MVIPFCNEDENKVSRSIPPGKLVGKVAVMQTQMYIFI